MKTINITFEDEAFDLLQKSKGKNNWHDFILKLIEESKK